MEEEQPAPAEEVSVSAEQPPAETPHGEAEEAPPPEGEPPSTDAIKPSKSNLVLEKRASTVSKSLSRVRLVEPGEEAPQSEEAEQKKDHEEERRKSETERRKSESERRPSEAERRKSETEKRHSERTERRKSENERRSDAERRASGERRRSETERRRSETERRRSETERRRSDAERRRSEAERLSRLSTDSTAGYRETRAGSKRPSISTSASREGVMRRRSDSPSKAKSAVGSTISIRRTASGYGEYFGGAKAAKFMNTYKLESDNPFQVEKVQNILRDVLTEALDNLTYDPDKCPKQAKWASSAIRAKVKEQEYDRYKLVIIVTIGEKRYQDMCSVVRFLWDIDRDKYALFVHENMYVYAAAMCFGLYYE